MITGNRETFRIDLTALLDYYASVCKGGDFMETMGISQFKAHALKILDQVAKSQVGIIVTKRGKPLARVIPYRSLETKPEPGKLADYLVYEKDIVTPLGEDMWDACK
jgi:prevent-host-death family protein